MWLGRGRQTFGERVLKMSINSKNFFFSRAHGNFEEQNKVLEPSTIIINYCVIIIIAYYNYTIPA
jgi:hypothetical protein